MFVCFYNVLIIRNLIKIYNKTQNPCKKARINSIAAAMYILRLNKQTNRFPLKIAQD